MTTKRHADVPASPEPTFLHADERRAKGKALRDEVPRDAHAHWKAPKDRVDIVEILERSNHGRLDHLVPIRHGRMMESAFAFFRGTADIMAADLASTPVSGIRVQACGDAHLSNFGGFATPERRIVFDMNDFDETSVAPWEWDVKRLAASFVAAARTNVLFSPDDARECAWRAARSYRKWMRRYAEMPALEAWYDSIEVDDLLEAFEETEVTRKVRKKLAATREVSSHEMEFAKLAVKTRPAARIVDQPPMIFHAEEQGEKGFRKIVEKSFLRYKETLPPSVRLLLDRYELVDVAKKIVGVGSVGTNCGILLLQSGAGDPLFLQFKEAGPSVLARYAGKGSCKHDGERIVRGQQIMQSASDKFLGWLTGTGEQHRSFYIRQLNDVKLKPQVELAIPSNARQYARYCGRALARAHCRSGDAVVLSAYLGESEVFEESIADFAVAYADQTERDHQALLAAVRAGVVEAQLGI